MASHFVPAGLRGWMSVVAVATTTVAAAVADPGGDRYVDRIRPLLAERCTPCHGGLKQEAGLRLDTVALMLEGGESGSAVARGDPARSLILERMGDPEPASRMPPEGEGEPLSAEELELLRDWIAAGCPAPADEKPEADPRDHWAFQPRVRPAVPQLDSPSGGGNPIDAFLAAARAEAAVVPQPEAARPVLVRRLFVDLIGLPPRPEELAACLADSSADWYERLVDRLLADPRHGERWARHWMDVWRYADWWGLGSQHRNSQKHMWRFRDWIVDALNADLGYDEMLRQMLAGDELHPDDPARLPATGFLARDYTLFNRTAWLDQTVEHVGKGILGLTFNCSKCHAHKYDPIQQEDFYRLRAFFEPIQARLDVVPDEGDLERDGIPRVFDGDLDPPTYLFIRGDDTKPDMSKPIVPGVPEVFTFREIEIKPVELPRTASEPERRPWVLDAHLATARRAVAEAEARQDRDPSPVHEQGVAVARAELHAVDRRVAATRAAWAAEEAGSEAADDPLRTAAAEAAGAAAKAERELAVARAWAGVAEVSHRLARAAADRKDSAGLTAIEKQLAKAREDLDKAVKGAADPGTAFTPLAGGRWTATRFRHSGSDDPAVPFPAMSSGRRTALAAWITDPRNPLPARVAANHIWLRHMGKPLVSTAFDFGRKGNAPTHPDLLDWLASELVDGPAGGTGWSMKHLHRLICTSAAYRMSSSTAGSEAALAADPDNRLIWRREPIRLESQVIRDAILAIAGTLDPAMGGPPVPPEEQAGSRRRSLYFWHSEISRNPFLTTFDDASPQECYQREQSIVPQQALAVSNSGLVLDAAAAIAEAVRAGGAAGDDGFLEAAFRLILQRGPSAAERAACEAALARWRDGSAQAAADPAQVHLVWALLNHNDFVTLR